MKSISIKGVIDAVALYGELNTALGAPGTQPQRWYFIGSSSDVTVYFVDDIAPATVQTVLDTHVSQVSVDARAAAKAAAVARVSTDLSEFADFISDPTIVGLVNQSKAQWITWAGTNFPTLTSAERTRLGTLFWVVSIGVRKFMR